jgi:membrane-associated phospholipid phosphatase
MIVALLLAALLLVAWLATSAAPRFIAHDQPLAPSAGAPAGRRTDGGPRFGSAFALLAVASLGSFALVEDAVLGNPVVGIDQRIQNALSGTRSSAMDAFMIVVTELGDQSVFLPVAVAILAACALTKRWHAAIYLGVAIIGAAAAVGGGKMLIKRARPLQIYDGLVEYSFPSGHAAMTMVLLGFVALLVMQGTTARWQRVAAFICFSAVLWVCLSRLYLGAHWFSDVTVGLLFGLLWLALLGTLYLRHDTPPVPARILVAVTLAAYALGGGWHVARSFAKDTQKYAAVKGVPKAAPNQVPLKR